MFGFLYASQPPPNGYCGLDEFAFDTAVDEVAVADGAVVLDAAGCGAGKENVV